MARLALLLFVLPGMLFAGSGNDSSIATYRTTVSEVSITFVTTDQNNHPVNTVQKDDFAVVDNSVVVREFRSLSRSGQTALDVVLLVDASESVAPRFPAAMKEVLRLVSQTQAVTDDRISVVSFSGLQPAAICAGDCRGREGARSLLAIRPEGATPLFDALAYGAQFLSKRRNPGIQPVLILFSDGNDTISRASLQDALQALISSGTRLYAIDTNMPGEDGHGSAVLQQMSDATGGRYFAGREDAGGALQSALEDLHASYVVTYQVPSPRVGFHSLRILPKHNLTLRFRSRNGYYCGTSTP